MSKGMIGVLIALLIVACSVGSAQERKVEFSDPEIGSFSFVADHDEFAISTGADVMVADGIKYPFRLGSVQVWDENKTTGAYVSLCRFDGGRPSIETEKNLFIADFIKSSGEIRGAVPIPTTVGGHNATKWVGVGMPYLDEQKRLRHFRATIVHVDVDSSTSMAIGAEDPFLSQITDSIIAHGV